jgi:hypothetical protein
MASELGTVEIQGRMLRCLICSHDMFSQREIDLSAPGLSFFTEHGSRAHCAVCARCGHVHMFIPPATVAVESPAAAGGALPQGAA